MNRNKTKYEILLFCIFFMSAPSMALANFSFSGIGSAFGITNLSTASLKNIIDVAPFLAGLLIGLIALVGLWLVGSSFFKFIKSAEQGGQVSYANSWATLVAGTLMLTFSVTLDVMQNTIFGTGNTLVISYVPVVAKLTHGQLVATSAVLYIQVVGIMFLGSGLHGISKIGEAGGQDKGTGIWKVAGGFFCINLIPISEVIYCNTIVTTNPLLQVLGQSCPL